MGDGVYPTELVTLNIFDTKLVSERVAPAIAIVTVVQCFAADIGIRKRGGY